MTSHRGSSRKCLRSVEDDQGSVTGMLLVLALAIFALAGLVLDGGAALAARGQATDIAQQAARAGADALTPSAVYATGSGVPQADQVAAVAAAQAVIDDAEVTGTVTVSAGAVTVTVHATRPTLLLGLVGVDRVGGVGTATAFALRGTTSGGN